MRFIRLLIQNSFRDRFLFRSIQSQNALTLRVTTIAEEDNIRLCFSNSSSMGFKVPQNQDVSTVLSVIKLKYALLRKREELRRSAVKKYSRSTQVVEEETTDDYEDVHLYEGQNLIDETTPNIDAWSKASDLRIGDTIYKVQFNTPTVKTMTLPEYIVCGCYLRPHFILECASLEDSVFTWYRSVNSKVDVETVEGNSTTEWIKLHDGFNYFVTSEAAGCYLKLVCSPREGSRIGPDFAFVSKNVVERGPERFPFEERLVNVKSNCDNTGFRCVSYNTLANMYVERRKFPYSSDKARDIYYRKQLLLREILGYNSDIICLQEVTERVFEYDFSPIMKKAGYDGIFTKKGGHRFEGLASYFRSSKFNVLFNKGILLNEMAKEKEIFTDLWKKVSGKNENMSKFLAQDTALQIALLESKENPVNRILIANTHLYSHKDRPEVRLIQAALCVYYLEHLVKEEMTQSPGIVFCGDFNSLPDSEAYKFVTSGSFHCCPTWKNTNLDVTEDSTLRHDLNLESACGTPNYTNYTDVFQGCLDYIFYSKNRLEVTDIVPMPSHEIVTSQVGLPSEYFPSDHIALVCTLKWKK